ncbi:unnamed protein product [Oreochromis niloticus]|nr:unnamed protein product [Mustela putorius furo]
MFEDCDRQRFDLRPDFTVLIWFQKNWGLVRDPSVSLEGPRDRFSIQSPLEGPKDRFSLHSSPLEGSKGPVQPTFVFAGGSKGPVQPTFVFAGGSEGPVQPSSVSAGGSEGPLQHSSVFAGGSEGPLQHSVSAGGVQGACPANIRLRWRVRGACPANIRLRWRVRGTCPAFVCLRWRVQETASAFRFRWRGTRGLSSQHSSSLEGPRGLSSLRPSPLEGPRGLSSLRPSSLEGPEDRFSIPSACRIAASALCAGPPGLQHSWLSRAGKQNSDADGLSRRPHGELSDDPLSQKERERIWRFAWQHLSEPDYVSIDQHTIKAVCDRHLVYSSSTDPDLVLVLSMSVNVNSLPDSFTDDIQFASMVLPQISTADLAAKQRLDPVIQHGIAQVERGESPPPLLREELPELPLLLREVNKLELHNTLLVRKRQVGSNFTYQLVLPEEYRPVVLHQLHDQMGHMGIDRTLDLVCSRFYWPKMTSDVVNKIRHCERCVRRKSPSERAAPLVNIKTSHPMELLNVGDRVLVRNVRVRSKHKLADKWESSVYIVVKKAGNLPVYTVQPEGQDKPLRTLHRDLLLPCGYLSSSEKEMLTKQKRKMPVLPVSPVHADDDDDNDEEELISYLPVPFSADPVTFTTTIDLPNTSQPVPVINQPDVSVVLATEEENAILSEEPIPVPVEEEQVIDNETLEAGFEPVDLAETSHYEESLSSDPVTPEASSNNLSQQSPTESEPLSPEAEPPLRHSTRTRNPPDRLQYIKPGKPLLKSVQTFLHGLSSVFSFALQDDEEEETMLSHLSQPVIRCQPSPCTRTSMGLGEESVTTVTSDPTSASPFIVAGMNPV